MPEFEAKIKIIGRKTITCEAENAEAADEIFMSRVLEMEEDGYLGDFDFEPWEHEDTQEVKKDA